MAFDTPILFLVFNRPETTNIVWKEIRKIKPNQLFIAADAPRIHHPEDIVKCKQVREIFNSIDWPCHHSLLYREEHLGCKLAVSTAISWFFENVQHGIILEDDCLPDISFFTFCETMLIKFKDQKNIFHITGNNFQHSIQRGAGSYYFSKYAHIWGWATWKRAWSTYSLTLTDWNQFQRSRLFSELFSSTTELNFWKNKFNKYHSNPQVNNYWSLQWQYTCWLHGALTITPQQNLVTNIGLGSGTNTFIKLKHLIIRSVPLPPPYMDPMLFSIDQEADQYTFKQIFQYKGTLLNRIQYRLHKFFIPK